MSRDGLTTLISLGKNPNGKKAQFYCHGCTEKFDGCIEFARLKVLNWNGSCATQRTYCKSCVNKILLYEKLITKKNDKSKLKQFETAVGDLNEIDIAYIAGIIDGEGCVTISRKKDTMFDINKKFHYIAEIYITNTNEDFIKKIKNILGGSNTLLINKGVGNCKKCYQIRWSRQADVYKILTCVRDYLIIKRKNAEIVMKFLDSRLGHNSRTEKYIEYEIDLYTQVREINKKGKTNIEPQLITLPSVV